MSLVRVENILLFLTLLFIPTELGKQFWPQFSFVYFQPINYLSPTIYVWDLLAVSLLIVWLCQKPQVNKAALNLLLIFLLTQVLSLTSFKDAATGLVRLEQYLLAGLFGVYMASFTKKLAFGSLWLLLIFILLIEISLLYSFKVQDIGFNNLNGTALNLFLTNPVFGIGLNNFIPQTAEMLLVAPNKFLQPPQNLFLLELSETGLIGLLGFLLLISYPIWLLIKDLKHHVGMLFIWVVIMVIGLYSSYLLTLPQGYRMLFLVWGLSFSFLSSKIAINE